jgi:ribosomal protein L11 methyltransferase
MKTFHVTVPAADAELAADRLWQLGVEAVGLHDPVDGRVELWTAVGDSDDAQRRAVASLEPDWVWRTEDVVEAAETWREHVQPTWYADDGVVVPAWQVLDGEFDANVLVTTIEPATSFGLGDHPTTALTLGLLAGHVRTARVRSALDVGCGSGVLGIVAAQLGVERVRSVDISAGAVEATRANAIANGVAQAIDADNASLGELDERFDVVVANILAPTLISLADDLRRLCAPGGVLIISGILDASHDHVLDALVPLGVQRSVARDGWAAVQLGVPDTIAATASR